ncbi:hypothetical protein [Sphingobium sp.]|uniref:hypothetical protein n=1 Tax=Sphingobium sp. TaxID=1912891 RepID=UPI00257AE106|nr:hypothetical protein [Sphingobium sp.]
MSEQTQYGRLAFSKMWWTRLSREIWIGIAALDLQQADKHRADTKESARGDPDVRREANASGSREF